MWLATAAQGTEKRQRAAHKIMQRVKELQAQADEHGTHAIMLAFEMARPRPTPLDPKQANTPHPPHRSGRDLVLLRHLLERPAAPLPAQLSPAPSRGPAWAGS